MRRESHVRFCEGGGVRFPSATRLVRSIKEECLDRIVPLGESHLRRALTDYVAHYHCERNHQGLGKELIDRPPIQRMRGPVHRRQRMGGILSHYYRSAA
jgi:putative transposase